MNTKFTPTEIWGSILIIMAVTVVFTTGIITGGW